MFVSATAPRALSVETAFRGCLWCAIAPTRRSVRVSRGVLGAIGATPANNRSATDGRKPPSDVQGRSTAVDCDRYAASPL
ncbi:MAG: hypothetical protein HC769_32310 [Cyanobacteria bacterium CRU_2_1]|nr:hypothetical protein [Cyanobacteria bacterium CRU_2_1]